MDAAALWINMGILVATAGASSIAWWQAIEAGRRRAEAKQSSLDAERSRRAALASQEAAAKALGEANEIAREAKVATEERLELERRREARLSEHRDVYWSGDWPDDVEDDEPVTFELSNIGTTDARRVTLTMKLPQGKQRFELGDIPVSGSARAPIRNTEMTGRVGNALMARDDVQVTIHWLSPEGQAEERTLTAWGVRNRAREGRSIGSGSE